MGAHRPGPQRSKALQHPSHSESFVVASDPRRDARPSSDGVRRRDELTR